MREAADQIHAEVGHLMDDLKRLHERVIKLQQHFGQANEDMRQILISAEKVEKRGDAHPRGRIRRRGPARSNVIPAPIRASCRRGSDGFAAIPSAREMRVPNEPCRAIARPSCMAGLRRVFAPSQGMTSDSLPAWSHDRHDLIPPGRRGPRFADDARGLSASRAC